MATTHCTKNYHRIKMDELFSFANLVHNGIYSNSTVFTNPPFTQQDFITIKEHYGTARANYVTYGTTKKTEFENSKTQLIQTLDNLADYVTDLANGDISIILLSGFTPSKPTNNKKDAPNKTPSFKVKRNEDTGELIVEIEVMEDSRHQFYFFICSEGKELYETMLNNGTLIMPETDHRVFYNYTKSRIKAIRGLIPGTYYYIYVFVSNANGVSQLSQPKKVMAT